MTMQRYPMRCAAGSQACGLSLSAPADYAWNVNFNNGNSNWNNQDNNGFVRAVRSGECHDVVSFAALYTAWRQARRGKKPSQDQLAFDARWIDGLCGLQLELNAHTWLPKPPTCFIATRPKAREIHAPAFSDRVVHHLVVPVLERLFEPGFIFDSYSNRVGKGTHAAVERLQSFVRQVERGQGGGYYLQLDIRNFFNAIHRPTLYAQLKARMVRGSVSLPIQHAVHALLRESPVARGVCTAYTERERAAVPMHKRLENSPPGCGIAIGNLSSQFFANVYLNELDQFVRHRLKVPRYLRYVDDFVLVHQSREQLIAWAAEIEEFLRVHLRLDLKPGYSVRPLSRGIDFLGYVIFPTHTVVRRRVIGHARAKLAELEALHVVDGHLRPGADCERIRSVWASYAGHFRKARCHRLMERIGRRFPWLLDLESSA